LEIGDVVTVEPGVYLEGRGGVRVEDNYLIEENGAVCLTESLPREIFVI
jgi:Xaa-Pro aminopeptidase